MLIVIANQPQPLMPWPYQNIIALHFPRSSGVRVLRWGGTYLHGLSLSRRLVEDGGLVRAGEWALLFVAMQAGR
ncbi:hypothetical protein SMD11_1053 [Streptomyces albireticuli]|uniref:Uncharacterized protein n=1 Tax=Streptomyces albireticuli TaxID=1940 RepID=A0A1Z2KXE7_9ACTN|nr:hypothetical protein SMD11_1053 [Streptomyces albireticuli]